MRFKPLVASLIISFCCTLFGCNNQSSKSNYIPVTGIRLGVEQIDVPLDETYVFNVEVLPHNATNQEVTWSSTKPNVGYVDDDDKTFIPLEEGYTYLEVVTVDGGFKETCRVHVTPETSGNIYTVNIVAFNDFHGAIFENRNEMGLAKLGSYLKEQSENENTLTISQGDDWQGSIYSNHNRGRLVNDVYAYSHLSARTVGNHDFDWGVDPLIANTSRGYDGYVTPVLGANIYDYDFTTKTMGNIQQIDIAQPTVTYTLENGLKVGIVGVIGYNQITSITSSYTEEICFKDHVDTIIEQAINLKEEQGCQIVIASAHCGQEDLVGTGLENFVDLVLCGHTHRNENTVDEGLHYYQFGAYGECIGNITLKYNDVTKKARFDSIENITAYNVNSKITGIDPTIQSLIDEYEAQCNAEASEVLITNVNGTFYKDSNAANMMAKAIYERAVSEGHDDILLSYCNTARRHLNPSTWTYANIYEAFPFDNVVYIHSVKGRDILNEIPNYNNVYINPSYTGSIYINPDSYYKIAIIDYLLYHNNSRRYYDYFPSFNGHPQAELSVNYRLILRDWIKKQTSLNYYDYSNNNAVFDGSRLY